MQIRTRLRQCIHLSPEKACAFFKTRKGDYAQHDVFIGVGVPLIRKLMKEIWICLIRGHGVPDHVTD